MYTHHLPLDPKHTKTSLKIFARVAFFTSLLLFVFLFTSCGYFFGSRFMHKFMRDDDKFSDREHMYQNMPNWDEMPDWDEDTTELSTDEKYERLLSLMTQHMMLHRAEWEDKNTGYKRGKNFRDNHWNNKKSSWWGKRLYWRICNWWSRR